jgi:hypothetical protein
MTGTLPVPVKVTKDMAMAWRILVDSRIIKEFTKIVSELLMITK